MKVMNHPVVTFVVLVLVGVGGGYACSTTDATVVRLPDFDFYPAEVRETAAEAQMTLAPFPTISLCDRALIRERIDVALDPTRAVLGSATAEISDIASQFIVARFGSSTDEYLALRLSAGWTPKSDNEIEIGGGVAALEYFGLNTTGAGGDIATATEVLNGYAAAPDGINRYVGILDGVDVFVADITPAGSWFRVPVLLRHHRSLHRRHVHQSGQAGRHPFSFIHRLYGYLRADFPPRHRWHCRRSRPENIRGHEAPTADSPSPQMSCMRASFPMSATPNHALQRTAAGRRGCSR